jgi:TfoX/Sxy family transcriptional regulator of competence genes
MAYDETLAGRIRDELVRESGITEKKMFGGVVFLLNGNILVGVWQDALIVRVGPDASKSALQKPHVRPMDVTGKPMKDWLLIEPAGIDEDRQLRHWISLALKFVSALPSK